jgi:hypothetical protein
MDHLPLPADPLEPFYVPYLGEGIEYDGGDFDQYPTRMGWHERTVSEWDELFQHPTKEFEGFLQTWLFFGVLYALSGDENHDRLDMVKSALETDKLNLMHATPEQVRQALQQHQEEEDEEATLEQAIALSLLPADDEQEEEDEEEDEEATLEQAIALSLLPADDEQEEEDEEEDEEATLEQAIALSLLHAGDEQPEDEGLQRISAQKDAFSVKNWIRRDTKSSKLVVDTSPLAKYISQWHDNICENKGNVLTALRWVGMKVTAMLHFLTAPWDWQQTAYGSTITTFDLYVTQTRGRTAINQGILTSICLLLDLVVRLGDPRPVTYRDFIDMSHFRKNRLTRAGNMVTDRLLSNGWCPFEIRCMHRRLDPAAMVMVSLFKDIGRETPHYSSTSKEDKRDELSHDASSEASKSICTDLQCAQTQVNPEDYFTRHEGSCTEKNCDWMIVAEDDLHEILEKGEIPLISCTSLGDPTSTKILLVSALKDGTELHDYIAISHVWSEGLGNAKDNALPRCQMLRLSRLVGHCMKKSPKDVLFWLDTLCVPPDSKAKENPRTLNAQNLAISTMVSVYGIAKTVLVLDSQLLSVKRAQLSDTETFLRIFCSKWNTRLWTLQEGALARNLSFQFADTFYDAEDGIKRLLDEQDLVLDFTLKPLIMRRWHDIRWFQKEGDVVTALTGLMQALQIRSTSVASDEALCLTTLLQLDVPKILAVPPENATERMLEFWKQMPQIPSRLIFHDGPKLKTTFFSWAPASLLLDRTGLKNLPSYERNGDVTTVTPVGIVPQFRGFFLRVDDRIRIGDTFFFYQGGFNWFEVTLDDIGLREEVGTSTLFENPPHPWGYAGLPHGRGRANLCIILEHEVHASHRVATGLLAVVVASPFRDMNVPTYARVMKDIEGILVKPIGKVLVKYIGIHKDFKEELERLPWDFGDSQLLREYIWTYPGPGHVLKGCYGFSSREQEKWWVI